VERLLRLYAEKPKKSVLDPFMGMGTTLDVAAEFGLCASGIDINPLACLACEAKLLGTPGVDRLVAACDEVISSYMMSKRATPSDEFIERYAYTAKWFRRDTLSAVLALLYSIARVENERVQRMMFISAAQAIREVASVDPRCTHHLVTKKKIFIDPVQVWRKLVVKNMDILRSDSVDRSKIHIAQGSAVGPEIDGFCAEFVLIHPPYLGVIHYNAIHRLATDLLDYVSSTLQAISLRKYNFSHEFLKSADMSTDSSERYSQFVTQVAERMRTVVKPGGRCAVIVGDQRYKAHLRHPFTNFICEFEKRGFTLEEHFIWLLENNGGLHVLRRGHFIDHNYILVFHNEPT
jgi:site-specific DNA-methyltransferase (cytosine-N4-specific)